MAGTDFQPEKNKMQSSWWRTAVVVVIGLLSTTRAKALINGMEAAPGQFDEVLSLKTDHPGQCSAVLVGTRTVLTTASCVRKGGTGTVTIDGQTYRGQFTVHPSYPQRELDIAAGLLEREVKGVPPAAIGGELKTGSTVTLAGYGCTEDSAAPVFDGKLRIGSSVVERQHSVLAITGDSNGALTCYRDNGGPVFVTSRGGENQVAGLMVFGDLKTKNYVVRLDLPEVQSFLSDFAEANDVSINGMYSNGHCAAH